MTLEERLRQLASALPSDDSAVTITRDQTAVNIRARASGRKPYVFGIAGKSEASSEIPTLRPRAGLPGW